MTVYYWVAASPANFATTNWSNTVSGGPGGFGPPTTGDTAIFDGGSSQTCTVAAGVSLASLDCQGGTGNFAGTLTHNAFTITITGTGAGAFRLSSGMTYNVASLSSIVLFNNTTTGGTANLTSAGKNFAAITINNTGSSSTAVTQQQDNLSCTAVANGIITVTAGVFDAAASGSNYTTTCNIFTMNNSNIRGFLHGGTLTVGGGALANAAVVFNLGGAGTLTYTKGTGNIVVNAGTNAVLGMAFAPPSGGTINNLTLNNSTNNYGITPSVSFTCGVLTMGTGWNWCNNTTITCSSLAATGTPANPCGFTGPSGSTAIGLSSAGTCTLTWGILFGCLASGGGTFTATNSLGLGLTTGWAITPPADGTSSGIAATVWKDLLSSSDFTTAGSVGALMKAVSNLQYTVQSIGRGTVAGGGSTTSIPTSAFAPAGTVAGQFIGRVVLFDWNTTTAALQGQVGVITASTGAATPTFTVTGGGASTTLTTAPAAGDTFSVI